MHYQTEDCLSRCRMHDRMPIRCTMNDAGTAYHLRAATGERRWIFTGNADTALANAAWPTYGKNAVLWCSATPFNTASGRG